MNIVTKFDLDDHAWYMKNNVPTEVIISCVETFNVNTNQDSITYNAKNVMNSVSWLDHTKLPERVLFKSKNELMRSLFGNECKGIDLLDGNFSGCDASGGDCPTCGL